MKSVLLLCFLVSILEFTHSSRTEPDAVSAEIRSYGLQLASGLRMMRGGADQTLCFNTYSEKVIKLADRIKTQSEVCTRDADQQRGVEMQRVQAVLPGLEDQVQRIYYSLNECTDVKDVFKYLMCSIYVDKKNQQFLNAIERKSTDVYKQMNSILEIVQEGANDCFSAAQREAKEDTDKAFADLQKCLNNK